jgi:hypothetical protein
MQWTVTDGKWSGVYDPALAAFSSVTGSHAAIKLGSKDGIGESQTNYGAGTFTTTATRSANGGVDFSSKQVLADFAQTGSFLDAGSSTDFPISMTATSLSIESTGTGVKTKPLLDLLAFAIAHSDEEKIRASQPEVKSLLLAALPGWEHVDGSYGFADLSITSPVGILRAGKIDLSVAMDGILQDAQLSYGFRLFDIEVASMFLPTWAPALTPTDVDITLGATNLNLDGPARKAIGSLDLDQDPPLPAAVAEEIAAEFKAGLPKIVLSKSTIKNGDTEITAEGEMTFPDDKPVLSATISATGYDKVVASLEAAAASDPSVADAVPAALLVKGYAKSLPDGRLEWAVRANADGSVLVNGVMVKPADPAPAASPQ